MGLELDLGSPIKYLKGGTSSTILFQAGAFVLLLPFLHLLPKSKGFLPAASFCSH